MTTKKEKQYYRTFYRVSPMAGAGNEGHYKVWKMVDGEEEDDYIVQVQPSRDGRRLVLWCDCPGFLRQHYPKIEHKHVKLVLDYQRRGEKGIGLYKLNGNEVRFQGSI